MAAHTFRCEHCAGIEPATVALLAGMDFILERPALVDDLRGERLVHRWGRWHSVHLVPINDVPAEHACRLCGGVAQRVISLSRFNLRADGTQRVGWSSPGWSGIDYNKTRARHLRGASGETLRMSQDPSDNPGIRQVMAGTRAANGVTV